MIGFRCARTSFIPIRSCDIPSDSTGNTTWFAPQLRVDPVSSTYYIRVHLALSNPALNPCIIIIIMQETPWCNKSEPMAESPPTPPRRATTTRLLFGDEDLMGDSTIPSASTPQPYHLPSHTNHKRAGGHGEDNMWVSPHLSPSLFKTIDGRTVYSRNPFSSPMVSSSHSTNATTTTTLDRAKSHNPVPAFPVALSAASSWDEGATEVEASMPRLERRDSTGFELPPASSALWTSSKVRRLTIETNDVGKGQPSQQSRYSYHDHASHDLLLDHHHHHHHDEDVDRISPTDVTQFAPPLCLPPTTPSKPPRPSSAFSFYDSVTDGTPPRTFLNHTSTTLSASTTMLHPPNTPQPPRRSMPRIVAPTSRSHSRSGSCGSPDSFSNNNPLHTVMEDDGITAPHNNPSRFAQDFDALEVLGQGSFGTVYKCLSRVDGCLYAIKTTLRPAKGHADRHRMFKEVRSCYSVNKSVCATDHLTIHMSLDPFYISLGLCFGCLVGSCRSSYVSYRKVRTMQLDCTRLMRSLSQTIPLPFLRIVGTIKLGWNKTAACTFKLNFVLARWHKKAERRSQFPGAISYCEK